MKTQEAIRLKGLTKSYGDFNAVRGVDLTVNRGEFVSLLGPSGCGKTTTLRMIAGFITPTGGTISVDGTDITNRPPNQRNVGLVFQNYALWPHMTVFENIAFGLRLRRNSRASISDKVAEVLATTDLSGLEERRPRELSGGQQQRVALARALALEPPVMLMDEPLSNLDRKLRVMMRRELKQLQHRLNITTLFVTHDQEEALSMSDRVAIMNAGDLLRVATPAEIYEDPGFEFVADFVGQTNILDAGVTHVDGAQVRLGTAGDIGFTIKTDRPVAVGEQTRLMVRPEKIAISATQIEGDNVVKARITFIEYQGAVIRYTVETAGALVLHAETQNRSLPLAMGQDVWIDVRPEDFRLLRSS